MATVSCSSVLSLGSPGNGIASKGGKDVVLLSDFVSKTKPVSKNLSTSGTPGFSRRIFDVFSTFSRNQNRRPYPPRAAKGFGSPKTKQVPKESSSPSTSESKPVLTKNVIDSQSDEDEEEDDSVPEVVTNRMLKRITLTVGIPIAFGLCFFPFFYWLKVVQKVDIPDWLPLIVSTSFFGAAGLGISYGVISTSWDPNREGSLLGWREAQANWPVLWSTFRNQNK